MQAEAAACSPNTAAKLKDVCEGLHTFLDQLADGSLFQSAKGSERPSSLPASRPDSAATSHLPLHTFNDAATFTSRPAHLPVKVQCPFGALVLPLHALR